MNRAHHTATVVSRSFLFGGPAASRDIAILALKAFGPKNHIIYRFLDYLALGL